MAKMIARKVDAHASRHKKGWLATAVFCIAVAGTPDIAGAQAKTARSATATFDIPAQDLGAALTLFSDRAGLRLLLPSSVVGGKRSTTVSGALTREQALDRLLSGTGLTYRFPDTSTVTIIDPAATGATGGVDDGSTELQTITVERASDGTIGIVAKRGMSATKTDTPLLEVPQTVNVVTRKEMDDRGVTDINAIVSYTPGIRVKDQPGGQGMNDTYIRGFYDVNAAYYRDGLRNSFNPYDTVVEQFALERVDVVKGPSSVLYGRMQPGGLVNMVTKRPTETPVREVQVQYGTYDRKQVGLDFGDALDGDGTLLYRLTGLWRDSGTMVDHSPDNRRYFAPALTWQPDDATSFTVLGSYQKTENGGSSQNFPMANTIFDDPVRIPSNFYGGVPGQSHYDVANTSLGYEFKHAFDNGWEFKQSARYTHSDVDFSSAFFYDYPAALYNGHYARMMAQERPKTSNSFVIDSNVGGTLDTGPLQHDLLIGVDYGFYSDQETRTNSTNHIVIDVLDPKYGNFDFVYGGAGSDTAGRMSQVGLYAQDQVKFDNWVLTVGGRYDIARATSNDYNSRTISGGPDVVAKQRDNAFTGRVGLGYIFDNGVAPYASYSTSFNPVAGTDFSGSPFEPTTGQQWEAGVKYQPGSWNGFLSAAVFQITQQNVSTADPVNIGYAVQQGGERARGFEFEAKGEIAEGWNLAAGYSYTDTRITKGNKNDLGYSKVGKRAEGVPYHQASLWLDYQFQGDALLGLGLGAGARYVGSSLDAHDYSDGSQVEVAGYTLFDATLSYDFGAKNPDLKGLNLLVSGTNLTDERYFTPGFMPRTVFFGQRRAVNATLSYKW